MASVQNSTQFFFAEIVQSSSLYCIDFLKLNINFKTLGNRSKFWFSLVNKVFRLYVWRLRKKVYMPIFQPRVKGIKQISLVILDTCKSKLWDSKLTDKTKLLCLLTFKCVIILMLVTSSRKIYNWKKINFISRQWVLW